MKYNQVAI